MARDETELESPKDTLGKTRTATKPATQPDTGDEPEKGAMADNSVTAHMETILAAIRDTQNTLEVQIAAVVNKVGILRDQHRKLTDRVKDTGAG